MPLGYDAVFFCVTSPADTGWLVLAALDMLKLSGSALCGSASPQITQQLVAV